MQLMKVQTKSRKYFLFVMKNVEIYNIIFVHFMCLCCMFLLFICVIYVYFYVMIGPYAHKTACGCVA